ncbi:MAG: EAL domain-containing protein, partial [Vicinamibacteria bacterium]|nr:EAL domain-containing protein [Vicinamibacteria bacterium]
MASLLKMVYPPGGDPLQDLLSRSGEFRSVFQPVISLTEGKAIGFEGLLRLPADLALNNPGAAFAAATGTPWLLDLELAALDSHLAAV